jgi:hypothetical protein
MVSDFADEMLAACVPVTADTQTMVEVGTLVFVLDSALKVPHF